MNKILIDIYKTTSGKKPYIEWLNDLDVDVRAKIELVLIGYVKVILVIVIP